LTRTYARIIIPIVSGWVDLTSRIDVYASMSNFTYLGQFAPGKGLGIRYRSLRFSGVSNFILRYFKSRHGTTVVDDSFQAINSSTNFIVDHCSFSWGWDETASLYRDNSTFTIQNSIISEGCNERAPLGGENGGERHAFGSLFGGTDCSFFRNIMAHFIIRNPSISSGSSVVDIRDSVFYNWITRPTDGGNDAEVNMVNNYYKPGPGTTATDVFCRPQKGATTYGRYYLSGNKLVGMPSVDGNQKLGVKLDSTADTAALRDTVVVDSPFSVPSDLYTGGASANADDAYTSVLADAGMSLNRDAVDVRIIDEITNGTVRPSTTWTTGQQGIIENEDTVGGFPDLPSGTLTDLGTSGDGIPDAWKTANGLTIGTNYGVSGTIGSNPSLFDTEIASPTYGYRWIEIYSFELAEDIIIPEDYTLTVSSTGNGTTNITTAIAIEGQFITLSAIPNSGYRYDKWERLIGGIWTNLNVLASFNFIMPDADTSVRASFVLADEPETPIATGDRFFARFEEPIV
jgi:hypothetical protein